eukprot:CAMPEP_0178443770 /NCGR_PEP_ID=MMETSP0689_2-20121128/39095_1 /TAXON_ID=160604 /ORGANISM="Amphidinium massartii, Strain CS-259" /LENGTH=290 /DNA_ID=CAMNT_0020067845 /DNA_START=92 /DNA_END=960 /DNA_ORIENTATION=-
MVAINSSFDNPTPHGGPPFQGWKNGYGFGYSLGPGGYVSDNSIPRKLAETPSGERAYASSQFWRSRREVGQASSFGIGDRPDYAAEHNKFGSPVSPAEYGDVTRCLASSSRCSRPKKITIKPHFPSPEEKYRNSASALSGPGPAKYDIRMPAGQGSWRNSVAIPAYSIGARALQGQEELMKFRQPGPSDYNVRGTAGKPYPIRHATSKSLYDVTMGNKLPQTDFAGDRSPGPARYIIKSDFEKYGLHYRIANAAKALKKRGVSHPARRMAGSSEDASGSSTEQQSTSLHV